MKIILIIFTLFFSSLALSNEALFGSWETEEGKKMDIIDGFKPNVGPVIIYEDEEIINVDSWKIDPNSNDLQIKYSSDVFTLSQSGDQLEWNRKIWKKIKNIEIENIIDIKNDPDSFITELSNYKWNSFSKEYNQTEFTTTFSTTEGVMSLFDDENNLVDISSWGVASGIIKIENKVYIESRISDNYFIAVDDNDNFIVLSKGEKNETLERISLIDSREEFLSALTTGAWVIPSKYYGDAIYRFRPIEGELKGRMFVEQESVLTRTSVWEYSPSTGAFSIGYTEYNAGLKVGNILVFVDKDGEQKPYHKSTKVDLKNFTTSDVVNISISERSLNEIKEILSKQMSEGNYFNLFEFSKDNRTGYYHVWKSFPFQITGQTMTIQDQREVEQLYIIEDYVVFDENIGRKIDTRESRLKPKTDEEAKKDSLEVKKDLEKEKSSSVTIKVDMKDGSSEIISVPVTSLIDIKSVTLITN